MSLRGIIEVVLHLEHYQIVEYPKQGLFSFRVSLYQQTPHRKNYAIPYQLFPPTLEERCSRLILDPALQDDTFVSTTGLAKYSDETLALDDWVQFRLETEAYPVLNCSNVFLEVELRLNSKKLNQPEHEGELVQTVTLRLSDLEHGLFANAQAEFDSPFLSNLSLTCLGLLTTFKFAKYDPVRKDPSSAERARARINTVEELAAFSKAQAPGEDVPRMLYMTLVKKLRMAQFLIGQKMEEHRQGKEAGRLRLPEEFLAERPAGESRDRLFKAFLDDFFPAQLTVGAIMGECNGIREENFVFLAGAIKEWREGGLDIGRLRGEYGRFQTERHGERVFKSVVVGRQAEGERRQLSSQENRRIAKEVRGKNIVLTSYPIEDVRYEAEKDQQEIIFYEVSQAFRDGLERREGLRVGEEEERVARQGQLIQYCEKNMVVVLCHGFQGSSYDMQFIRRWIEQQIPDANFLLSRSNEDDTEGDIREMGRRLAQEIRNYVENYLDEYQQENLILNLVGHSMGGVVARAALPHLPEYRSSLGFFCSLSSPHLGYLNGVSGLVRLGLWAIRKWKNIRSLEQLSMEEKGDPRKTLLYELSQTGHLRYFRKIILLSSFEDSYVSWHSARISPSRATNSDSKVERDMESNIMAGNVYGAGVHRLDINFNVKTKDLDSFIGRKAHINLIVRENLFRTLGVTLPNLFQLTEFGREGLFL